MSHRAVTTTFAAVAAIATTAAIAMAAGSGPAAHTAALQTTVHNSYTIYQQQGLHTHTIDCPSGRMTGGGVRLSGTPALIHSSSPSDGHNGWRGTVDVQYVPAPHVLMQVYVVCATA